MTTLWTSTVSIVITTIPLFIFVYLFRSYRPRPGPRVTANKLSMSRASSPAQRSVCAVHIRCVKTGLKVIIYCPFQKCLV